VTVGVAPFERVAGPGQEVPDVATRLAQRLGTQGLGKVVGPSELGADPNAAPKPADVSAWGGSASVANIVVGRTTRLGRSLSVDARVIEVASGLALGAPLVEEIPRPEEMGNALDSLAGRIVARLQEGAPLPAVAAARTGESGSEAAAPKKGGGGGGFSAETPISITADELQADEAGGKRTFSFQGNVKVVQGDMVVHSNRLKAFYPPGRSSPDRLIATGDVELVQTGRVAHCEKATFYRDDSRVECEGTYAVLEQACDRVSGEKITFHLSTETMEVSGAADVRLRPDDPNCVESAAAAPPGAGR
jgi:lipopolysaccharide transport protein LptA